MRVSLFFILFYLFCSQLSAQSSVSGTVIERSSQKPIEFASVELVHLPDSIIVKGTATDKKGKFIIENVDPGNYFVRSSFIGYENIRSSSFTLIAGTKFSIGQLELFPESNALTNVTVTGTRAQLNTSIDRKIYNVEQDIMSRSGTASDILRNIPSIEVDVEGNVALRGSGDVMILINGKPNPLMGRTRAEVLQNLPANSIERIEVITNPSARYRPDGTSGIINIVLKKNVRNGFNGTVSFNAGNKDRYNGNISLNYRPKKLNLFASYSFRYDTRIRTNTIDRINLDSFSLLAKSFFNQNTKSVGRPHTHIITGGIDYTLDDKNSLGASATYYRRSQIRNEAAANITVNNNQVMTQYFNRLRYVQEQENQINGTIYFQHNFAKENHDLRLEFNTSVEEEKEDNKFTNEYRLPVKPATKDNNLIQERYDQNQLTIDYSNELSENSKIELGYDGLFNKVDLNFYGEYFDNSLNEFVKDQVKSNRFIYNEKVHAVYGTYQKAYEKFGYEVGLRSEAVFTKGNLIDLDSIVNNNYFNLYPTIHLSYRFKENNELQLNYSKRVNRPEADELNPFPEFLDPRNLRAGNPKLLPEIIHSVEFGYKWQNRIFSFVPSIYFRYKENGFTSVTLQLNDSTLLTTEQNLSNDQSAGLEAILSAKAGGIFNASLSTNIFYNRIDASNLGYIQNKSIYSATATLTSSLSITKTTMLQISSNYRSARLTPQGKTYPSVVFNSGIRQDMLKNKLSVTITASDIFSSQRQKTELNTPYLNQVSTGRRDGFIIFLGLNYRFGIIKKEKDDDLEFDNSL